MFFTYCPTEEDAFSSIYWLAIVMDLAVDLRESVPSSLTPTVTSITHSISDVTLPR